MSDNYKQVPEEMDRSAVKLEKLIEQYKDKLQEIQNKIDIIDGSSSWIDTSMKSAFNKTCNGYMKIHNNRALSFSHNIKKLKMKAKSATEFEQSYMKGR